MTLAVWKLARTVIEPAIIISLAVTALSSGVAAWSTHRVFMLKRQLTCVRRENTALRNEMTAQRAGARWAVESRELLRDWINSEDCSGKAPH